MPQHVSTGYHTLRCIGLLWTSHVFCINSSGLFNTILTRLDNSILSYATCPVTSSARLLVEHHGNSLTFTSLYQEIVKPCVAVQCSAVTWIIDLALLNSTALAFYLDPVEAKIPRICCFSGGLAVCLIGPEPESPIPDAQNGPKP